MPGVSALVTLACFSPHRVPHNPSMTNTNTPEGYITVDQVGVRINRRTRATWERIRLANVERFRDPATGRTLIRESDLDRLSSPVPIPRDDA